MKTLEEIKKFFPNHKFKDDYDLILIQFTAEDLIDFSEEYAKKVAIASIEWFDSVGIYINIEPYIGGGDVVFYFSVINRSADFTDEHYSSVNDDIYFGTRQEALAEAIKKANEIYNYK